MANSWSFLSDELNMTESLGEEIYEDMLNMNAKPDTSQDFWKEDGFSLTGNPAPASPDTIVFGSGLPGGTGEDHIAFSSNTYETFGAAQPVPYESFMTFGEDSVSFDLTMDKKTNLKKYKYSEDTILKELQDYISGTYNAHYSAGDDKIQTLDLIEACGDGESFCRSNILKYASRYDKKGTARRDIMKILHYAVLLMHFNDKNAQRETYPQ